MSTFHQSPRFAKANSARPARFHTTGTAVFLGGLKNGIATTLAETVRRTASTVISIANVVPTADCSRLPHPIEILFFTVAHHAVEVPFPTSLPAAYPGTAPRESMT